MLADDAKKLCESLQKTVGEIGPETDVYTKAAACFQTAVGTMQLVQGVRAVVDAVNARQTVETASLTSLMVGIGPAGWGRIALATASMAVSAGVVYHANSLRLRADLESPSEQTRIIQTVGMYR